MSRIKITQGVTGGFMPAVPSKSAIIDLESNGQFKVKLYLKQASSNDYTSMQGGTTDASIHANLISIIDSFKNMPKEDPPGCQDIYEADCSISIDAPGFRWENMPNQGCAINQSTINPSNDQKAEFKRNVDALFSFAETHATHVSI